MSAPIENFLARLEKVRPLGGDRWMACCCAHDDKTPSLSIRATDDEKIIFHCFAGCHPDDILAAIGLNWADLYPDRDRAARAAGVAAGGHMAARRYAKQIDPLELDRRVLELAQADIRAGKTLSTEDRARVSLAIERLEVAR